MFSKKDLDALVQLIKTTVKEETDPIKDAVKLLPTKDLFLSQMAELMKEIKASREEQTVISGKQTEQFSQLEDHDKRIRKLEQTPSSPN